VKLTDMDNLDGNTCIDLTSSQARSSGYPEPQLGKWVINTSPFETSPGQVDEAYWNSFERKNSIDNVEPSQLGFEIPWMCSSATTL